MAFSLGGINCTCCSPSNPGCRNACGCINVPDTLTLTDSALGLTVTLTHDTPPTIGSEPEWSGSVSYSYPGLGGCAAKTVTVFYYVYSCAVEIYWRTVTGGGVCPEAGDWHTAGLNFGTISMVLTGSGCSPFAASGSIAGSGSANKQGKFYGIGVGTTINVSGTGTSCCVKINAQDCSPSTLPGALVKVWSSSAMTTLIASGTTDATGVVLLDVVGPGTYIITAEETGYGTYAASKSFACGDIKTVTLSDASNHRWTFTGCSSAPLQNVALVVTGVCTYNTDTSGQVNLNLETGSYPWTATAPRFSGASGTKAVTSCADDFTTTAMSVAAGYHCFTGSGCAYPIADTLHATHPLFGAITLTYSSGNWVASVSYSYPGFGACGAKTVTVTCTLNGTTGDYTESWKASVACPDNAGGSTITATWSLTGQTCYVPTVSAFSIAFNISPSAGAQQNFYQGSGSRSLTITE